MFFRQNFSEISERPPSVAQPASSGAVVDSGVDEAERLQRQPGTSPAASASPDAPPFRLRALGLAISGILGSSLVLSDGALAESSAVDEARAQGIETIEVVEFRGREMNSARYPRDLIDTPRIVSVLPSDLLQEQNVLSLRDAMRNVPGISLQAGEGNPPGGDQLKIRGFNARGDIKVDGIRDMGNYFRDPFYVEQLEIVKGPNSVVSGRGSPGGTINFVTRKPSPQAFGRVEVSGGTDDLRRATVDVNRPIDDNSAFRVNLMGHASDIPGRDVVNDERWGFFGAYTWGFSGPTTVNLDWLSTRQDNIEDKGLPFDREGFTGDRALCDQPDNDRVGRVGNQRCGDGFATGELPPGIDFDDFFGHVDDYQDIGVDIATASVGHEFSDSARIRSEFRYTKVTNDSITSSPRIKVPEEFWGSGDFSKALVQGDLKPRDQEDEGYFNQTDLVLQFRTGGLVHDLVTGFDIGRFTYENRRRPDVKGQRTSLLDPERRTRPAAPYATAADPDESTVHKLETEEAGAFVIDTIRILPQLDLTLGARWDRVEAEASEAGRPDARSLDRTDEEWSWNVGLVYKPTENSSLYLSSSTAFEVSGNFDRNQVQLAGGPGNRVSSQALFDVPPEETEAFELGFKWEGLAGLAVNAALFRTDKTKARVPGIGAGDPSVLDTEQRVDGAELLVAGQVTPRWRLFGGYTFLDSEVRQSTAFPALEGQDLGGTPEHSFNVFTTYDVTDRFSFGGGLQYVDDQISTPQLVFDPPPRRSNVSIDSYTVVDLYSTYRFTDRAQVRINLFNLLDEEYISQMAQGGAQGIPGKSRHLIATFRYDF
ncbi:MAG: TonB-dependent receptor [Gammaproteobacteria bacterium]|nr:TonB-dependent receptor [Gammaproteobacteria bacterium]